jgi:hypothetical protein
MVYISFLLLILAGVLNHLVHNRNNKFELITSHIPKWLKRLSDKLEDAGDKLE